MNTLWGFVLRIAAWDGLLVVGSVLVAVICASLWFRALRKAATGAEILAWTERRPVPWGLIDVVLCFVLLVIFEMASLQMLGLPTDAAWFEDLTPSQQTQALLMMAFGRLGAMIMGLLVLMVRAQARSHDTGVTAHHVLRDVGVGVVAFAMVGPPIYLLQDFLSKVWPNAAHPLVDMVRAHPSAGLFGAALLTAVIAAPLTEEFLLRGLFQGWLEKLAVWNGSISPLLVGGTIEWSPRPDEWTERRSAKTLALRPPLWPVFVSSGIFAAMHIQSEPSPDPIALFFFALAVGFVYQRTHRLLPCVVMHVLLNSCSMVILAASIWAPATVPS